MPLLGWSGYDLGNGMFDKAILQLPGARRAFVVLLFFAVLRSLLVVGQAASLAFALSNMWGGESLDDQVLCVAAFFACFMSRQGVSWGQDVYLERFAADRADELRARLLRSLFTRGSELVTWRGTGNLCALALEGIEQIETYLRLMMPKAANVVVVPLILLAWIFPFDWVSGLIALVVFPFIILYMVMIGHSAKSESARRYREFGQLSSHFVDSLRGLNTLKFFGRSKDRGGEVFAASERFRTITMKTLRIAMLSGAVLDVFATLSLAAVAIMLGFRLADGTVMLFSAAFVLILTPEYFRPVREFAADYHASLDGKNALAAVFEMVGEGSGVLEGAQEGSGKAGSAGDISLWNENSTLAFKDVDYVYPGASASTLSQISFDVRGCVKVGIVGLSGSGKSTLLRVLAGFSSPSGGTIVVNGRPTQSLHSASWQAQATYIPQDPYIFHATLRENMTFYRPDASVAEVQSAVDVVGLREFVDELPQGLDTLIGEGGRAVSGGQAQRIALSRMLLDPSRRILLFDEPTAHLDIETELELKERMLPLMEDRLVFFATHRLHWMADVDVVLVMDGGRIVEQGDPDKLLAAGGAFARLADRMRDRMRSETGNGSCADVSASVSLPSVGLSEQHDCSGSSASPVWERGLR